MLLHLPTDDDRGELQAALLKLYGYTATGLVADVRSGTTKRKRNECGYWGSTFDYITRHKSQQAFRRQNGASWRASRRDETGRHVGIKCPFVGRRWAISRNIQRQGAASP